MHINRIKHVVCQRSVPKSDFKHQLYKLINDTHFVDHKLGNKIRFIDSSEVLTRFHTKTIIAHEFVVGARR